MLYITNSSPTVNSPLWTSSNQAAFWNPYRNAETNVAAEPATVIVNPIDRSSIDTRSVSTYARNPIPAIPRPAAMNMTELKAYSPSITVDTVYVRCSVSDLNPPFRV